MVVTRNSCKVYQRKGKSLSKQKDPDEIISDVLTQINADTIDQDALATTSIFPSSINKQQQIVIQQGKRKTSNKEVASTSVIPPNITKHQIVIRQGKRKTSNKEVASTSVIPPNITERVQFHMMSSPSSIVLLCDNLNDKQKSEVKDIGFGGLLHLNIRKSYHGMAKYFIDQYDVTTSVFIVNANCKFTISQYDICDIFGLPLTNNYIVESLKSRENNSNDQLIEEWKEKLDCIGQKEIPVEKLFSKMVGV